ncbi:MAG: hypothetical protein WA324_19170 [Bryobacteraceae bacterium]
MGEANMVPSTSSLNELMFELDSLYVSTQIILGAKFRQPPFDGLLLEACLLHFRNVWDFFYAKGKDTDVFVRDFIPMWRKKRQPPRLKAIRRWLDVMLAHLTTFRIDPSYKIGEVTNADIRLIRAHTKTLFDAFVAALPKDKRKELVNPLASKFAHYETLKATS